MSEERAPQATEAGPPTAGTAGPAGDRDASSGRPGSTAGDPAASAGRPAATAGRAGRTAGDRAASAGRPAAASGGSGRSAGGPGAGGEPSRGRPDSAAGRPDSTAEGQPGWLDRIRTPAKAVWARQRERWPWLDHAARAYRRYADTRGNHLAAAITYFSFLALFPLLLLAVSIAGYVLAHNPNQLDHLTDLIRQNVPGSVGQEFADVVNTAVTKRGTIGIFSLLGVAYAGLGWIGNLRTALQVVWACETTQENPIKAKLEDLLALVGLGLAIGVSLALTAGGTAAAHALLRLAGLDSTAGMGTAVRVLGILLATAADTLVFAWLFTRLPRRPVHYRPVLRGALFTAVGYEILKIGATFYLARVGANGVYGGFVGFVGLLIWLNLVSRFLLFGAAWTATSDSLATQETACPDAKPEPSPPVTTSARG